MTWLLCDAPVRFSTLLGMLPCAMVAERFAERFVEQLRLLRGMFHRLFHVKLDDASAMFHR